VATAALVAAMATTLTTAAIAAVAATAAIAAIAATTVALVASSGLLFTAQEGDADDREKDRDPKNYQSVHSKSSKRKRVKKTGRRYVQTLSPSFNRLGLSGDGEPPEAFIFTCVICACAALRS
jgi:hypothetical protein